MKRLLYIERLVIAVLLLLLLALAPAMAQTFVRTGETTPLEVIQIGFDTYSWELYDDVTSLNFATTPGNCPVASAEFVGGNTGPSVNVKWKKAGFYFFKVTGWDVSGCTSNFKVGMLEVKIAVKAEILPTDSVCIGDEVFIKIKLTGTAPWRFTLTDDDGTTNDWEVTDVTEAQNPYILLLDPKPSKTTEYWISKVSDIYGTNTEPSNKVIQIIYPLPDPSNIIHR